MSLKVRHCTPQLDFDSKSESEWFTGDTPNCQYLTRGGGGGGGGGGGHQEEN